MFYFKHSDTNYNASQLLFTVLKTILLNCKYIMVCVCVSLRFLLIFKYMKVGKRQKSLVILYKIWATLPE